MSGLVWKQNAWGATRKRNAKDLRKRIEAVEVCLVLVVHTQDVDGIDQQSCKCKCKCVMKSNLECNNAHANNS